MKYARFIYQYRYQMQKRPDDNLWPRDGNIGDCIQSIAVENIFQKAGIENKDILKINRDDLKSYDGERCRLVMQAWFGNYAGVFPLPWSDKIDPVFIGFHINKMNNTRGIFVNEKIHEKMNTFEPIGCRDRSTRDFLCSLGLNAYFSGCLTLTFDKRTEKPKNGKTFIVDLTKRAEKKLPNFIKEKADRSISHFYYWNTYPVTLEGALEFEQAARDILNRYKNEAELVITSKIHVAMPCIAMGIPVIFINEDTNNERFDVLKGLLPLYTPHDIKYINWNPEPVNIDVLKEAIIQNAIAQITNAPDKAEKLICLNKLTAEIKPIEFLPLWKKLFRKIKKWL